MHNTVWEFDQYCKRAMASGLQDRLRAVATQIIAITKVSSRTLEQQKEFTFARCEIIRLMDPVYRQRETRAAMPELLCILCNAAESKDRVRNAAMSSREIARKIIDGEYVVETPMPTSSKPIRLSDLPPVLGMQDDRFAPAFTTNPSHSVTHTRN
ncbi:hypothetical protein GF380_05920 [Candidatus Uhrbacteria bacterium]|nr:hypothetical protein [Candidatus Uhrbacteria bacterium]